MLSFVKCVLDVVICRQITSCFIDCHQIDTDMDTDTDTGADPVKDADTIQLKVQMLEIQMKGYIHRSIHNTTVRMLCWDKVVKRRLQ